jgi:hypothetical protein
LAKVRVCRALERKLSKVRLRILRIDRDEGEGALTEYRDSVVSDRGGSRRRSMARAAVKDLK